MVGGGAWSNKSYKCMNYWFPSDLSNDTHKPTRPGCHDTKTATFDCIANMTEKVKGDDSEHMLDVFEEFLNRKSSGPEKGPFLAQLWFHTQHEPHPALYV